MSRIEGTEKYASLQTIKRYTNRKHDVMKIKQDYGFLQDATASIASALLRLGGTSDFSINSICSPPMSGRKRTVSVVADALAASDGDTTSDGETDTECIESTDARPRKKLNHGIHSQSIQATKSKLPISIPLLTSWKTMDRKDDGSFSFGANEFKIKNQPTMAKIPGELGCITDCLYNFRPLRSAPGFPSRIVPPTLPCTPKIASPPCNSPNFFSSPGPPLSSAIITEHTGCYIMHSYTILPRQQIQQHPPLPSQSQIFNAMPNYHQQ